MTLTELQTLQRDHPFFVMMYDRSFEGNGITSSMLINFADEGWHLNVSYDYSVAVTALSADAAQVYWITDRTPSSFVLHSKEPWPANNPEDAGIIPNVLLKFTLTRTFNIDAG